MKIAVTCENNTVFQHFGHTPEFALFEIDDGIIRSESRLNCGKNGHGALAGLLQMEKMETLICGGIGGGAVNALKEAGISIVGGASGNVRMAVEQYLAGTLETRADFFCTHHAGEHTCHGSHSHD